VKHMFGLNVYQIVCICAPMYALEYVAVVIAGGFSASEIKKLEVLCFLQRFIFLHIYGVDSFLFQLLLLSLRDFTFWSYLQGIPFATLDLVAPSF
jgi:hypothetical protein